MTTITVSSAVELVRKNLEELDPNGSVMYHDENGSEAAFGDNRSLDKLVAYNLPEAINAVHMAAPVQLLEGVDLEEEDLAEGSSELISVDVCEDDPSLAVLSFTLNSSTDYLRLVAFRAADSAIVVTDPLAEASPEARKQLNPYIRGRKDRPRLVQLQGRHTGPSFKYYTVDAEAFTGSSPLDPFEAIALMKYVKEQKYAGESGSTDVEYNISRRLRQNIIDTLTATVLETYGDQRAQVFAQKANNFPNI